MRRASIDGIIISPPALATQPIVTGAYASVPHHHVEEAHHYRKRHYLAGALLTLATILFAGFSAYYVYLQTKPIQNVQVVTVSSASNTEKTQTVPAVAPSPDRETKLTPLLIGFSQRVQGNGGVVVIDLQTGETVGSNKDQVFTAASIYKLFVAESVYKAIESGQIKPTSSITNCLKVMITVSDNACGERLGTMVGWDKQNQRLHKLGYTNTYLRAYGTQQTSAHDTALLLQRLYKGELVNPAHTASLLASLKAQTINNRLPTGLPAGSSISHKTGDLNGYIHDAGIVYSPNGQYIIAALSGPWRNGGQAPAEFKRLSQEVHGAMTTP